MTEINFISLTCPRCGGELERNDGIYECRHCNKKWEKQRLDSYEQLFESVDEALRAQRREDMARLKRLLYQEAQKKFISAEKLENICEKILAFDDRDFYANFYLATCKEDASLGAFLSEMDVDQHFDDIPDMLDYLFKGFRSLWILPVGNLIDRAYKMRGEMELYTEYSEIFQENASRVEGGIFETTFTRDVFVAYSSKDMKKVEELVCVLEEQNKLSCFVAARNLRHGVGAVERYDEALKSAIDHCKIIVFVSSHHSRSLSCDAYKELTYVRDHHAEKPRVEYLLEDYGVQSVEQAFGEFFEGREYCTSPKTVAKRVIKLLIEQHAEAKKGSDELSLKASDFDGTVKYCIACKQKNNIHSRFCKKCRGERFVSTYEEFLDFISKFCKKCGQRTDKDSKFCEACGHEEFFSTKEEYLEYLEQIKLEETKRKKAEEEARRRAEEEAKRKAQEEEKRRRKEKQRKAQEEKRRRKEEQRKSQEEKRKAAEEAKRQAEEETVQENTVEKKSKKVPIIIATSTAAVVLSVSLFWFLNSGYANSEGTDTSTSAKPPIATIGTTNSTPQIEATESTIVAGSSITPSNTDFEIENGVLKEYTGTATEITIPDSVTSIADFVFSRCDNLIKITIPNSVISIGDYAFYYCSNLQEIVVPDSVTSIGWGAFSGCSSLREIVISDSVTLIDDCAFSNCSSLQEIVIPNSVTSIGTKVFYDCNNLQKIVIPDSVTSIGDSAFDGCSSLQEIVIPDSVTSIGTSAFDGCSSLQEITISNAVTSIASFTFYGCKGLQEIVIPDSVTSIDDYAFYNCDNLTVYFELPESEVPASWTKDLKNPPVYGYKGN